MPQTMKIATCCYCGTRAALVLDRRRHELACSACGAPLHEMKMMPQATPEPVKRAAVPVASYGRPSRSQEHYNPRKPRKKKYKKRRKGLGEKIWEEIWDKVEDIFD